MFENISTQMINIPINILSLANYRLIAVISLTRLSTTFHKHVQSILVTPEIKMPKGTCHTVDRARNAVFEQNYPETVSKRVTILSDIHAATFSFGSNCERSIALTRTHAIFLSPSRNGHSICYSINVSIHRNELISPAARWGATVATGTATGNRQSGKLILVKHGARGYY